MTPVGPLGADEFEAIRTRFAAATGVRLLPSRHELVAARLTSRIRKLGLGTFAAYLTLLDARPLPSGEWPAFIDLLTTHETSFLREPQFHPVMVTTAGRAVAAGRKARVWSAACSTGEEAWTVAMALAASLSAGSWEVLATDVSSLAVSVARDGVYDRARVSPLPRDWADRFLAPARGDPSRQTVTSALRRHVSFSVVNLSEALPPLGFFDVVLLRNVLLYFDEAGRRAIVDRVVRALHPTGVLVVGRTETLRGIAPRLVAIAPSVFTVGRTP